MSEITAYSIFAVIGCGLFFAAADFTRKKAGQYCTPAMLTALVFTSIVPLYLVLFFMADDHYISMPYLLPGIGTVIANVTANVFFVRSVSISPLSKTIPLLSLTPVFTALFGFLFLDEALQLAQWGGIALVVFGILWLYVPDGSTFDFAAIAKNFFAEKGAKFMCIVAGCWTFSPIFERVALRYTSLPTHGLIHFALASVLIWLWISMRGGLKENPLPKKQHWPIIGVLTLCYGFAAGFQMLSLKLVYVGIMESVKRVIGQISAVVLGRLVFNEPITKTKIFGIIAMAIGVPLIILT